MISKVKNIDVKRFIINNLLVVLGTFILGFGVGVFIVPFDLVTGGVSGLAIVLDLIIPWDFLTVDLIVTIVTWILFFLGLIFLGKDFALKTLISSIFYPIALSLSLHLVSPDILDGFFYLQGSQYKEVSVLLAAIFGGAFVGAGCAITFLGGGSTGGVDILAFMLCKIFKNLKSSIVIFIVDASIILLGMFIINDLVITLLGICSAFICALAIDKVFLGESKAFIAQIVSEKYQEINRGIIEKIDRTTTIVEAHGGYSGLEKKMLVVSFTMSQYASLIGLIASIDKNAFVTIHRAHEINGEGWTRPKE